MPKRIDLPSIVQKLKDYYQGRETPITYGQLEDILGYNSKGAVRRIVPRLIDKGILRHDKAQGKLYPTSLVQYGVRILGVVAAGFPSPAEEELLDTLSLDEFLIKKPNATYIVKVSGDSMIDEGIKEGDLVLVERGRQPQQGDIVIAQVDGQWTMKYFEKKNGKVILRAANKKYPDIEPKRELVIGGVVVANVRKYK
jgi:SOS regulatory protein LexA